MRVIITILPALLAATAARAMVPADPSLLARYVRARAAEVAGDSATANRELASLLARDPTNTAVAARAYREALLDGQFADALAAVRLLDRQGASPPDGALFQATDAIARRDWATARTQVDRLEQAKVLGFLAPLMRAWITVGAHDGDPQKPLAAVDAQSPAAGYLPVLRALLAIAAGDRLEGARAIAALPQAGVRPRLIAADVLVSTGHRAEVTPLLAGDERPLAIARARVAAGQPLPVSLDGAGGGIAQLLIQLAVDFDRQKLGAVSLTMARLATLADPHDTSAWLSLAEMLGRADRQAAAIAALDHVPAGDPFGDLATGVRIATLLDMGAKDQALAAAQGAAHAAGATAESWAQLGDVLLSLDRPADAAGAYAQAIPLLGQSDRAWALWLQQGDALEQAGDWPGAQAALEQARKLAPDQPVVLNHLGYSELSRRQDVAGATRLIEQASRLRPGDAAITDSLGWARFIGGDKAQALTLLEAASAAEPGEPTINEHLGDVYWAAGRRREARYAWSAALVTAEDEEGARVRRKLADGLTAETAAP